ncbi:MAG: 16S rRNA (guanine(966)-N(2))-methyltransferase RsmD [Clostridia bacterium]|nr:16S rRNA (guanine(966)-N(2))-methyltransferase RsmD [Clostridia bacterium]
MRIISGIARGTKLMTLDGNDTTRPTLDRVKEPMFSIIQNWIQDANVLDLFSGSGALGLEALSRGAKKAILCDNSIKAGNIIKENISKTKMEDSAELIIANFKKTLNDIENQKFDIVFLDPPYKTQYDIEALKIIIEKDMLADDGIIVLETDSDEKIEELKNININIYKIRKYGRIILAFLNRKG